MAHLGEGKGEGGHFGLHAKFLNYWEESLWESLPASYDARVGEQICVVSSNGLQRRFGPDVSVVRSSTSEYVDGKDAKDSVTTTLNHVVMEEEVRTSHIEIIHRPETRNNPRPLFSFKRRRSFTGELRISTRMARMNSCMLTSRAGRIKPLDNDFQKNYLTVVALNVRAHSKKHV